MDRFIDATDIATPFDFSILKSNMDRFIVQISLLKLIQRLLLKSNMDRFIVVMTDFFAWVTEYFKIQYGQIYSDTATEVNIKSMFLKSNMDRFIGTHKEQRKRLLYF